MKIIVKEAVNNVHEILVPKANFIHPNVHFGLNRSRPNWADTW